MPMTIESLATAIDPALILDRLGALIGIEPDDWQRRVLRSQAERLLLCTHRQAGKSTAVAALAIHTVLHEPGALVLLVSASQRQSDELFRKVTRFYELLGSPVGTVEDNAVTLALTNGSRIVSLPDSPDTCAGFSAPRLVIIDEAARTSDETYLTVSPMLLVSRGRMVAMSTPRGKRGFFWDAWSDLDARWEWVRFRASENKRLDTAYLADELRRLGPRWYAQDYECSFEEAVGQVFATEAIDAAFANDARPMFDEGVFNAW